MTGKYKEGKIFYTTPYVKFLTGGSWKSGWSGVGSSGGEEIQYEIDNPDNIELIDGKRYRFEIINDKAKIIKKKF